jgi:hypothetical protein
LIVALLVCSVSNADTIMLANGFANNPALRIAVVDAIDEKYNAEATPEATSDAPSATALPATPTADATTFQRIQTMSPEVTEQPVNGSNSNEDSLQEPSMEQLEALKKAFAQFELIGWTLEENHERSFPDTATKWISKIIGILITTFAVSLGSPFWFDVLNRVVNLRTTGAKPPKSSDTTEEEKQEHKLTISLDPSRQDRENRV